MGVLTSIAIGALIAGTATKAVGQHKAGKEEQRVADANAALAAQEAIDARRRGETEASDVRREVRGLIGRQTAGYAGQNVDVSSGTAAALGQQTEALLQSDLARMQRNVEREALGYKAEAADWRQRGKYARSAAKWNVASTVLGGGAETALAARQGWRDRQQRAQTTRTGRRTSTDWEE